MIFSFSLPGILTLRIVDSKKRQITTEKLKQRYWLVVTLRKLISSLNISVHVSKQYCLLEDFVYNKITKSFLVIK